VSAAQILSETVEANTPFSRVSKVSLNADLPGAAFDVLADDNRIQQVFSNLISNAVKFSHEGGSVEISAEMQDGFGVFRIKDHGIGISEEFRPRLFDRFTQEDSSDTRRVGGTGLGLAISKAIVENHGGTLDFESEVGVGTTFWFTIPLA
jgi:signal transduction histidine kinase